MRVNRETKERTRQAILQAARVELARSGYEAAKTRNIAAEAGIAAGTLFNYYASKEALGVALVAESLVAAEAEFEESRRPGEGLEERLFAYIAIQLRHLEADRTWAAAVLETAWSPLRSENPESQAGELRRKHLECVAGWLREYSASRSDSVEGGLDLHLYWSLYLGVVSYWARDDSHNQEATLALLDRSIGLFCRALRDE